MNFWLLAFGIGYPPKIKHPSSRSKQRELYKKISCDFYRKMATFFLHKLPLLFRAPVVCSRGLCLAEGSRRRTWMRANIDRSRPRFQAGGLGVSSAGFTPTIGSSCARIAG